jgi:hypothetical protein
MQPLEQLVVALDAFEKCASQADEKSAVAALRRLSALCEIRSLELAQQRQMLTSAECAGDAETLRALNEHTQHAEIREWCAEILNLKPQPRTLSCQRIQL